MVTSPLSKPISLETALKQLSSSSTVSCRDSKTLTSLSSAGSSSEGSTEMGSLNDDSVCVPTESSSSGDSVDCIKVNELSCSELLPKVVNDLPSVAAAPNFQVRVAVRIRPNPDCCDSSFTKVLSCDIDSRSIEVDASGTDSKPKRFTFDAVFDENTSQSHLYKSISLSLLDTVMDGYNATIMAYGQTGSGKTYTMGTSSSVTNLLQQCESFDGHTDAVSGLIPRFMTDLFRRLDMKQCEKAQSDTDSFEYQVTASFLEVYGDDVYDLLASQKSQQGKEKDAPTSLRLREERDGKVICIGLSDRVCKNAFETLTALQEGSLNRTTASTAMNSVSSRSHAIFTITIKQTAVVKVQQKKDNSNVMIDNQVCTESCNTACPVMAQTTTVSQFTFVDLAGSERLLKTGCVGQQAKEGIQINQGLLALGNVIHALASKEDEETIGSSDSRTPPKRLGKRVKSLSPLRNMSPRGNNRNKSITPTRSRPNSTHKRRSNKYIPYRDSRLTRLLQDALGGNSQTYFLACVSSHGENLNETLSTLQYANRAKNICNTPKKTSTTNETENGKLQQEVNELRALVTALQIELQKRSQEDISTEATVRNIVNLCEAVASSSAVDDAFSSEETMHNNKTSENNNSELEPVLEIVSSCSYDKTNLIDESFRCSIKISEEVAAHENEIQELRRNLVGYADLKARCGQLIDDVGKLEEEKQKLTLQLETMSSDNSKGTPSYVDVNKKIESIDNTLRLARAETSKQRQACRKAEQDALRCRLLESKILEMNKCLAALSQQRKDDSKRHQQMLNEKNREISMLKRKEQSFERGISKLQADVEKYQRNLDRRQELCMKLKLQLKQTETKAPRMLLSNQDEQSHHRNRIRNSDVATEVRGNDTAEINLDEVNESQRDIVEIPIEGDEIADNSPEIQLFYELIEKSIREKVKFAQLTEQFEQLEVKYNNAYEVLDSAISHLDEIKTKQEVSSAKQNLLPLATVAEDDDTKLDEEQNILMVTDVSDAVVEELEITIQKCKDEIADYEDELELIEIKLNRCEERDTYENNVMKQLIKSKSASVLRTLFLGLADKLAESEISGKQLEQAATVNAQKAKEKDDQIVILQEQIMEYKTMFDNLPEHVEEEENTDGLIFAIVNAVMGKDKNVLSYCNAFVKFYFVATIAVALRETRRWDLEAYLHILCCTGGFVAGFRELIGDDEQIDQYFFSTQGFLFLQLFFFVADLAVHIVM